MFSHIPRIAVSAALLTANLNLAHAAEVSELLVIGPVSPHLEHRSETVRIGDLNLITDSGQATLMRRLHQAVKDVCGGPLADIRRLRETQDYHACDHAAMADAASKARTVTASAQQSHQSIAAVIVTKPANH